MKFEGTFINEQGKKAGWWFNAPSQEALNKHLQEKGWKIVSIKRVPSDDELVSSADVLRGSWMTLRFLWCRMSDAIRFLWPPVRIFLMVVIGILFLPIALILVILDRIGKAGKKPKAREQNG